MIDNTQSLNFIDEKTIGTFSVATLGIVAVTAVFRRVFKIHHPLVPLICAVVISVALAISQGTRTILGWVIVVFNAALLFCSSIGANELGTGAPTGGGEQQGGKPMPWFKSYFKKEDE